MTKEFEAIFGCPPPDLTGDGCESLEEVLGRVAKSLKEKIIKGSFVITLSQMPQLNDSADVVLVLVDRRIGGQGWDAEGRFERSKVMLNLGNMTGWYVHTHGIQELVNDIVSMVGGED